MAGSRPYASWARTHTCNSAEGDAAARVMALTAGRGVDTAIEAVGVPETFLLCQDIVGPGGIVANIGVHGQVAELHLERLWAQNIAITKRLVDTVSTPMLRKTVQSKKINPRRLITHRFKLEQIQVLQPALSLVPRIRQLPNGRYQGYVEYRAQRSTENSPESYVAGSFESERQALVAATRLLHAFRASVIVSA